MSQPLPDKRPPKKGSQAARRKSAARRKRARRRTAKKYLLRSLLVLFTVLILAVFVLYQVMGAVFLGPSQKATDRITMSMLETSALKFIPRLYLSEEEIETIKNRGRQEPEEFTDTSLVVINTQPTEQTEVDPTVPVEPDLYVDEIVGPTYRGFMMVVRDPSRVIVGTSSSTFSSGSGGLRIADLAARYGAIGAINGGAFVDEGGHGNGGMPQGITYSEGKECVFSSDSSKVTVGFTADNILVVGKMSKTQAREMGLRDAVSFGPALIVNGETFQQSSGLNPRTAIGQRADGAVLLLVIDGRKANCPGATYDDLIEIMLRYGAVNACNLDGGSSSNMYYNGEIINVGVALTGSRRIPTAFIVR